MEQGMVAPRWPYPSFRRGQREAAEALARAVTDGDAFALAAPTGFGKTAVTIYGLIKAGVKRVMYLVRTRNEIVPVLRELKRFGVDDAVFLYSARRMCPLLSPAGLSLEDFWENCRILRLSGRCSYYLNLERIDSDIVKRAVWVGETPFEAVKTLASLGFCPFFALKTMINNSAFIVATYPYLFRRDIFASTFEPLSYEDFVIVVDEAHSLLNIAGIHEVELSLNDIEEAVKEIREYSLPEDLGKALTGLRELVAGLLKSNIVSGLKRAPRERILELLGEPSIWEDAAAEVRLAKLRESLDAGHAEVKVSLSRVASFATQAFQDGTGTYLYDNGRRRGLKAIPLEPCSITQEPFQKAKALVLVSGTMPPANLLSRVLCIGKKIVHYEVEALHGPIYGENTREIIIAAEPTSRYTSRNPAMYATYARYILETYRATRRAVLAVYPSYDFMRSVVAALHGIAGYEPLYDVAEEPGSDIDHVLDEVVKRSHIIIHAVAGGKLAEGVEFRVQGRSLIGTIFIAGVPYPQPDDYLQDSLTAIANKTGDPGIRHELYESEAIIRIRQAIGRAQRDPLRDKALIILADTRYLRRKLLHKLRLGNARPTYTLEEYSRLVHAAAERLGV